MRLLRGLSFHWGWFLRYKLYGSRSIATHPGPAAALPSRPTPEHRQSNPSPPRRHAVRPQTPARHTAYPLSPTDSGGSGRLSVCYGVSRASYIFSGCITLHPRSPPPTVLSPAPVAPRRPPCSTSTRTAPVIYCPGVPEDPCRAARGRNFHRPLAKLELRSSFRDRLMFRRFIKTEKRRGSREAGAGRLRFVVQPIGFRTSYLLVHLVLYFELAAPATDRYTNI